MNLEVVVGLSNLGPEGLPRDGDLAFDPMMEREAAEQLLASLRGVGARPPSLALAEPASPNGPRSMLARVNVQLRARGMPTHAEPAEAPPWQPTLPGPLPVEALLRLRRLMAHHLARPGMAVEPLPSGADPRADPVMEIAAVRRDNHLIHHGDAEGFYLPVSFSQVVHDPTGTTIPGGWVGSSHRLAEELREIAPLLDLPPIEDGTAVPQHVIDRVMRDRDAAPFHLEERAWLLHTEAAAASLRHGAAIVYR
ncbi:MAG TPA: hypothetical protein VMM55_09940 [Thermohalobaculum sp.]|nr:hypothetical protein [Thermohalobaculum sp.]